VHIPDVLGELRSTLLLDISEHTIDSGREEVVSWQTLMSDLAADLR
jgi:hypothetical protein